MYIVTRFDSAYSRPVLQMFKSSDEALNYLALLNVSCIEEDKHNPGCFDGIGSDGRVYTIEKDEKKI